VFLVKFCEEKRSAIAALEPKAIAGFIPIGFICVYLRLSAVSKKPNYMVGARE
jgi:hypothetical protein